MADTLISGSRVYVSGGGPITVGSVSGNVAAPTAEQIANAQTAINAMSVSIDTLLTAQVTVYFVPQSFFEVRGWTSSGTPAWGYTPTPGKAFVNNGLSLRNQRYVVIHEIFHSIDSSIGVMNHAKRATIAGLMTNPTVDTAVSGYWGKGSSPVRPSEVFADTAPAAFASMFSLDYYTRKIPAASYAAYRAAVGGAGAPASTTLASNAVAGAMVIHPNSVAGLNVGDTVLVKGTEYHSISAVGTGGGGGTGVTLAEPLTLGYVTGDSVVETAPQSDVVNGAIDVVQTADTANGSSRSHVFSGLAPGDTGTVKIRFFDGTAWGDWSDEVAVSLAVTPGKPKQLTATVSGTDTPDVQFGASLDLSNDPHGSIEAYAIRVYQQVAGGQNVAKMIVDEQAVAGSPNRVTIDYSGNVGGPLAWDQAYLWAVSLKNEFGIWSPYTDWQPFTPTIDTGPVMTIGGHAADLGSKIDTLTPTIRVAHRSGANIDQARVQILDSTETATLYDSGIVPHASAAYIDVAVPAGKLAWGLSPKVRAAVRATGDLNVGAFSDLHQIHVNAQPGAPYPLTVRDAIAQVVRRADGVWIAATATPTITFPYRDTDRDLGYTDDPTQETIELKNLAEAHVGASPYVRNAAITDDWPVPAAVLAADTTYKARAKYKDGAGVESGFSDFLQVRYSAPPTISSVTPADGDVETDPTPAFSWIYASAAGKPQGGYQLVLSNAGNVLFDSLYTPTVSNVANVPPEVLENHSSVDYRLRVYDSDGLFAEVTGTITTAFTAPPALTGLILVADPDAKAIEASWNPSTDDAFSKYLVYARSGDEQFRLVDEIADPDVTTRVILGVGHNVETIVRVTQSNDFQESEPLEGTATLGGVRDTDDWISGYWLKRPERVLELPHAKHGQGDTQADLEVFTPPGRVLAGRAIGEKVILNWGSTGYEATISIFTNDRAVIDQLRAWKDAGLVAILSTWYGKVRYVRLTATPDTDLVAGWIDGQITYIEVNPLEEF